MYQEYQMDKLIWDVVKIRHFNQTIGNGIVWPAKIDRQLADQFDSYERKFKSDPHIRVTPLKTLPLSPDSKNYVYSTGINKAYTNMNAEEIAKENMVKALRKQGKTEKEIYHHMTFKFTNKVPAKKQQILSAHKKGHLSNDEALLDLLKLQNPALYLKISKIVADADKQKGY